MDQRCSTLDYRPQYKFCGRLASRIAAAVTVSVPSFNTRTFVSEIKSDIHVTSSKSFLQGGRYWRAPSVGRDVASWTRIVWSESSQPTPVLRLLFIFLQLHVVVARYCVLLHFLTFAILVRQANLPMFLLALISFFFIFKWFIEDQLSQDLLDRFSRLFTNW